MSIYRTYFNKDATIVRNSCANTGRNPIAELFHGGSLDPDRVTYSRYIFNMDLTELVNKVNSNEYFLDKLTHKINITNTSCFDLETFCRTVTSSCGEVKRANGFNMILFEVPEIWTEGRGYDYIDSKPISCIADESPYCEGPVNWEDRLDVTPWVQEGVYIDPYVWYSGDTGNTINLVKGEQFFDKGDENLCIDITEYVNSLISSGITECSLGIAFTPELESAPQKDICYIGFFTKDTQTVYEPFMESIHDDLIKDDRCEFHLNKQNRLHLFVNAGGERVNASFSGVTIYDHNDNIYQEIPSSGITQLTTGVYYVDIMVTKDSVNGYCGGVQFRDVWENVTINGNNIGDIELDFIIKETESYYNVGSGDKSGRGVGNSKNISIYDYHFSFSGIKRKEKIKRGDTRRINIEAKIPYTNDFTPIDKISYRVYIKEGEIQLEYIPWVEVNRTEDSNFLLLDTSWFIPNDYFIEFKLESGNEVRTYHDIIQFEIVSEKDWC